jgi:dTDP-4-amino-4,6-dideoxygalactose transaminase
VEVGSGSALRDSILAALHAENVLARKYFWPGCHRMQPYRDLFPHAGMMLGHTEKVAEQVLVLPNGNLPTEAIETISDVVRQMATCAWS